MCPPITLFEPLACKVVLLGDSGVGKTALLQRYINGYFHTVRATIGVDFRDKELIINSDKSVKLKFWDTGGSERFDAITRNYLHSAQVVMVVFDMSKQSTFDNVSCWIEKARAGTSRDIPIILVGNKCDIVNKEVDEQLARDFAERNHIQFFICSAKAGIGFGNADDDLFPTVGRLALKKLNTDSASASQGVDVSRRDIIAHRPPQPCAC